MALSPAVLGVYIWGFRFRVYGLGTAVVIPPVLGAQSFGF
jgi:hypothetical protein